MTPTRRFSRNGAAAALTAALLALTACGTDESDASTEPVGAAGAATSTVADDTYGGDAYGDSSPDTAAPGTASPAAGSAALALSTTSLGEVLTDGAGMTLYLFTPDKGGTPTCSGTCAGAWPPFLVDGDAADVALPDGVDPAWVSTIAHPDGGTQLMIGDWPLYYFAGDSAPGDVNGQGSGDQWFVVGADGKAVK
jgi:predicted lipoprotein with Yx(FWY)xxD motif